MFVLNNDRVEYNEIYNKYDANLNKNEKLYIIGDSTHCI